MVWAVGDLGRWRANETPQVLKGTSHFCFVYGAPSGFGGRVCYPKFTRHPIPGYNAVGYGYLVGALPTRLDRRVIGYTRLPTRPLRYRAEDT
eukprot:scaffold25838_cov63-Cyclotella_meneghiniana.AAC.5